MQLSQGLRQLLRQRAWRAPPGFGLDPGNRPKTMATWVHRVVKDHTRLVAKALPAKSFTRGSVLPPRTVAV